MKTLAVLALLLLAYRVSADPPVDALKELSDSWIKLCADVTALQSLTQDQQTEVETLKKQLQAQAATLEDQQTEVDELKKQLQGKQVAFSASLLATGYQTFGPFNRNTPLVFKHVVTNIGNAYSPVTGAFTAPLKGAYHFEWHIYGSEGRFTGAVLVKNSKNIFLAFDDQPSGAQSASNGASLLLEAGDVVFVSLWRFTTVYDDTDHYNTFSGHMIFTQTSSPT